MSVKNDFARLTIDIPKEEHRKLKAQAALMGKSMRELILESLEIAQECFASSHIPNEETRKAIEDAQAGIGLEKADSIEDLFKKIGV